MFVSLKPVRMPVGVWVGRGVQGVCWVEPGEVERRKEVEEGPVSPGWGEGCPEPQRRDCGDRCLGGRSQIPTDESQGVSIATLPRLAEPHPEGRAGFQQQLAAGSHGAGQQVHISRLKAFILNTPNNPLGSVPEGPPSSGAPPDWLASLFCYSCAAMGPQFSYL